MYIAALISSITAFVCSFVPLLGIPFTVIFSVIAITTSLIKLKKDKEKNEENKENKDSTIISLILAILAIIVCFIMNVFVTNYSIDYLDNELQYGNYYQEKFKDYKVYDVDNNNIKIDKEILTINNITRDESTYYIDVTIKALEDEAFINIYNFGIYDAAQNDFNFASTNNQFVSGFLKKDEDINIVLEIKEENKESSEKYLVYMNGNNGIKVLL